MTTSLVMLVAMGVMFACALYLMLDRSLTRVLLGFLLMGNAVNVLIMLAGGPAGRPPLTDGVNLSAEGMNDPLPHAMILTAIVITFALSAFLLAMIYRSWRLVRNENLEDDIEDVRISLAKGRDSSEEAGTSGEYDDTEFGDEALVPIEGAIDLDEDGSPTHRTREHAYREPRETPEAPSIPSDEAATPAGEHDDSAAAGEDAAAGAARPGGTSGLAGATGAAGLSHVADDEIPSDPSDRQGRTP